MPESFFGQLASIFNPPPAPPPQTMPRPTRAQVPRSAQVLDDTLSALAGLLGLPGMEENTANLSGQLVSAGIPVVGGLSKVVKGLATGAKIGGVQRFKDVDALADFWRSRGVDLHVSKRLDGSLAVDKLIVPEQMRGQGVGTDVMMSISELADAEGKRVVLNTVTPAEGWGTTSQGRLRDFYKRQGFIENKGRRRDLSISHEMYRDPATTRSAEP